MGSDSVNATVSEFIQVNLLNWDVILFRIRSISCAALLFVKDYVRPFFINVQASINKKWKIYVQWNMYLVDRLNNFKMPDILVAAFLWIQKWFGNAVGVSVRQLGVSEKMAIFWPNGEVRSFVWETRKCGNLFSVAYLLFSPSFLKTPIMVWFKLHLSLWDN